MWQRNGNKGQKASIHGILWNEVTFPGYEILGTGIRVYFSALRSALIDQPKAQKHHSAKIDGTLDDTMDR